MHLPNLSRGGDERLAQIFFPRGKEHVAATEVRAGDIGAVTKLAHTLTGDTLGVKDGGPLPPLDLPGPAYSVAITPKARGDEEKISSGLARLSEEDPTLHVERIEETHQLVIAGPGRRPPRRDPREAEAQVRRRGDDRRRRASPTARRSPATAAPRAGTSSSRAATASTGSA